MTMQRSLVALLAIGLGSHIGGCSSDASRRSPSEADSPKALIEGLAGSVSRFREASFDLHIDEVRYVPDGDRATRPVKLLPKTLRFKVKGDRVYFWHNGGNFNGDTRRPVEGTYEGARGPDKSVVLDHTHRSMYITAKWDPSSWGVEDPRNYLGMTDSEKLLGLLAKTPQDLSVRAPEEMHGSPCQVLELAGDSGRQGRIDKYWIDRSHGFLPRKIQVIVAPEDGGGPEKVMYEVDVPGVGEVAPGVWAPRQVRAEGFRGDLRGFHFVRDITFSEIDVSHPIADGVFVLDRPPQYYVHDEIRKRHYQPETEQPQTTQAEHKKRDPIYDEKADGNTQVAEALARAKRQNKRVLIMYGGNWCSWCYRLHDCFQQNADIRKLLEGNYELVLLDINANPNLPARFGAKPTSFPYLTVLDAAGHTLVNQDTDHLEEGKAHSPTKVLAFLSRWKPSGQAGSSPAAETAPADRPDAARGQSAPGG